MMIKRKKVYVVNFQLLLPQDLAQYGAYPGYGRPVAFDGAKRGHWPPVSDAEEPASKRTKGDPTSALDMLKQQYEEDERSQPALQAVQAQAVQAVQAGGLSQVQAQAIAAAQGMYLQLFQADAYHLV